jgi:hypothetical protein
MKLLARCPLISITALTVYVLVNMAGGALHHHHETVTRPADPLVSHTDLQLHTTDPADEDGDEDHCLLCSVLHLAQTVPEALHVEGIIAPAGKAVPLPPRLRPPPSERLTRARSPPLA